HTQHRQRSPPSGESEDMDVSDMQTPPCGRSVASTTHPHPRSRACIIHTNQNCSLGRVYR
ncbi:hypothetical protein COCMIDRAFT_92638, partial [Bipolaris oryzae ATCC 44560]